MPWCGINGIIDGVQEIKKNKEDTSVMLSDFWHSKVIDFRCVSSRTLCVKFTFSMVKVFLVVI